MKIYIAFLLIGFSFNLNAQRSKKYKALDEYLGGEFKSIRYDIDDEIFNGFMALSSLKGKFSEFSNESEYWEHYAWASYLNNKNNKAITSIEKAIFIDSNNYDAKLIKARLLFEINQDKKSARSILEGIIKYDKTGLYNLYLGIFCESDLGFEYFKKAKSLGLVHEGIYVNLSAFYIKEKNYDKALEYLDKSIKILPNNNPSAYNNRALIYIAKMNFTLACEDFAFASKTDRQAKMYYDALCINELNYNQIHVAASLLSMGRQYNEAILLMNEVIKQKSDSAPYYTDRGYSLLKTQKYDKAIKDFKMALTLPNNNLLLTYQNLILSYEAKEDFIKAIEVIDLAIKKEIVDEKLYAYKGRILVKLKKYDEAEIALRKSLKLDAYSHTAYAGLAELNLALDKLEDAKKYGLKSVELNPIYDYGNYVLGKIKGILGEEDACLYLQKAKQAMYPVNKNVLSEYCIK